MDNLTEKKTNLIGKGQAGPGRPPGKGNKVTTTLKEAILEAAVMAGGPDGLRGYLQMQAVNEPVAFMGLLGKVLPLTIAGDATSPLQVTITSRDADL